MLKKRIYAFIASRRGLAALVALILLAMGVVSVTVWSGYRDIEARRQLFKSPRIREGIISLHDLTRLNEVIIRAEASGGMSEDLERQLDLALDILWVRIESLERHVDTTVENAQGTVSLMSMREIVDIADAAKVDGFSDLTGFFETFTELVDTARRGLTIYVDELREVQLAELERQSALLLFLKLRQFIYLAIITAVLILAIALLRREIIEREERQRAERRVRFLAYYDPLTKLANRTRFYALLEQTSAAGTPYSVAFLDLDRFKVLNDTYGHETGDAVLAAIGSRLQSLLKKHDGHGARLGGDEFAVLLPTEDPELLSDLCNLILDACAQPVESNQVAVTVNVSIGVAARGAIGQSAPTREEMLSAADFALYEAKSAGRSTFRLFNQNAAARLAERQEIIDAIPVAIGRGEFYPVFQPKVELISGKLYGYEALVRWQRGDETISPDIFLPFAEESRAILDLDLWMLNRVTAQVSAWNRSLVEPVSVSLNLSALHFERQDIVGHVRKALEGSALVPGLLTLEVTESLLIRDWAMANKVLLGLRQLGVRISLDDFGTGYSSLAYLRRLPVDELKLDRSFLVDVETSEQTRFILDALIDIASSLNMDLVAEGIETVAQARVVRDLGCQAGQGYLFGEPQTAAEIEAGFYTRKLAVFDT